MSNRRTLLRPLVTEKSSGAYQLHKEYTFRADPHATKGEIRATIEELFGVHVVHIRTLQQRAKRKTRRQSQGTVPRWKKAYIRLKDGESLPVFEG